MQQGELRYRQVHLDFHTSAECEQIGADFDPLAFVETIKLGHVNSVTVFAKCHHGFSYYPTKRGTTHPHLAFDLLGQQLEALHAAGIRAPIYVSLMWDDLAGQEHPEWLIVDKRGQVVMRPPLSNQSPVTGGTGWSTLDPTSGYGEYLLTQVDEICQNYSVDGFFFDICIPTPNYSPWNQARMRQAGIDLADDATVFQFTLTGLYAYLARLATFVRERVPGASVFFNNTVTTQMGLATSFQTHLEVESLPTSGQDWGYLHYPLMARQARTYGLDFLGMTGRFHKSWADFGGLKTRDQLNYECGTILGAGGKISVGDQLHPGGTLDPAVYRLLGDVFARVERLEPWLAGSQSTAEIALLAPHNSADASYADILSYGPDVEGAAQLFLEAGIQFDIIDAEGSDFSSYPALVLPDGLIIDEKLKRRLEAFVASNGKIIASGTAGLDADRKTFVMDGMPVTYMAPAPTTPSYLRPDSDLAEGSELATDYDYVFYETAHQVQPVEGAIARGTLRRALFNRTWEHFTSHAHAPVGDTLGAPLMVEKGNILYFAAPLFRAYRVHDYWAYRALALSALRRFLARPLLRPSGPGWAEFTLHTQPESAEHPARQIVHIVTYQPRRSLQPVPHVEQSWATSGLSFQVFTDGKIPTRVYLAPDNEQLSFTREGDSIRVNLPPLGPHAVVVLE